MKSKNKAADGDKARPSILGWLSPHMVIFFIFVMGVYLLLSASIPAETERLKFLKPLIPLEVIEFSHFSTSIIGVLLIFLARGLQRRLDSAWMLAVAFLAISAVLALLKGWHYEEACVLGLLSFVLFWNRPFFRRRGSLRVEFFSQEGLILIAVLLIAMAGLGFFFYRRVEYSSELWWRFAINSDAPRFLRSLLGVVIVLAVLAATRFLRPASALFQPPGAQELEDARRIILNHGHYSAWLTMLGDKSLFFNSTKSAFLMYRVMGRSWIALGDPVGPVPEWKDLILDFRRTVDQHDGWAVFHEVTLEGLSIYLDLGFQILKVGEEAKVDLHAFSMEAPIASEFRHTRKKLESKGCSFEMLQPPHPAALFAELKIVSDGWLKHKHTREKKFSLGCFDEKYLANFPIGVVRCEGRVIAFLNVWTGPAHGECSADLMRYLPDKTRPGLMDYLFTNLLLWGKSQGFRWLSLGMAPLSGLEENEFSPLWHRLGGLVYRHGENFYNFRGLRAYKEKFGPSWESRYLVSPGGPAIPRILAHISALTSGGWLGVFFK